MTLVSQLRSQKLELYVVQIYLAAFLNVTNRHSSQQMGWLNTTNNECKFPFTIVLLCIVKIARRCVSCSILRRLINYVVYTVGSRVLAVSIATKLRAEQPRNRGLIHGSWQRAYLFSTASRPALGHIQPRIQ
jgi:uncharacterized membrane protein